MRLASEHLTEIIEPIVSGLGYECVGVEFVPHGSQSVLRVFIDSEQGIVVDDCAKVSHQLSGVLDVENPIPGNYQLEISSPGVDRPLFKLDDFDRFKGQMVEIQLFEAIEGHRKHRGMLQGVLGQQVLLEIDGAVYEFPFDLIRKACLAPDFFGAKQGKRNGK